MPAFSKSKGIVYFQLNYLQLIIYYYLLMQLPDVFRPFIMEKRKCSITCVIFSDGGTTGCKGQCYFSPSFCFCELISIKQIEAPYVFDWENAIALQTMQGNRTSSRREWKVSWVFSICGRNLGYILGVSTLCISQAIKRRPKAVNWMALEK